ncbi:phosphoribosyl-AMP cyclohydrolase, phosphoribosyl-ATP pyrophosphatase [Thermovirga lienii DSM 17291]|jgi:phosphoribosyl-ATP pyrophosphohydrolase/phosphoribosyl-AMP cyclohydrolase|uniref:Histidine biosynthesis bifunctional protein HisIE n=1 Tax=Thermovirga lienii (strain ATCC BAA-1197 / DSM 17291 / Cas60314) TaxID=580340 RepID=G7V9L2_THELD|nr:bifunctional phosphoribosyl-AMP cyclohydrolase/phosphoribosyl-ATP diphosphatase HisIE [Thermovirga lienii]AER66562.1 phosphoribosyl-AMP cyclohydrolase, phosphoribosyl-ATP pyrophosphatase [Thermovirga lienii DSM 17291]MDN5318479.1 phosphoribosyl-AMP cyclohydrolase / phosphoribosyl-ATP pyrophosphohydrolase [Thermovirga sp.]
MSFQIEKVKFNDQGLIPIIVQDQETGLVLMMAWTNKEGLAMTLEKGELVFWSRSRGKLWHKGETSGNTMKLKEILLDCDGDTLLALVEPQGPACHTGEASCFFTSLDGETPPKKDNITFLHQLVSTLKDRKSSMPKGSYTASLFSSGIERIAQKIGEEGVETALAAATGKNDEVVAEMSDLLYHCLVALTYLELPLVKIWEELSSRHGGNHER